MLSGAVKSICYFSGPFLKRFITGKPVPTLSGYKITHRCNLKCVHCPYWKRDGDELDFEGVKKTLRALSDMGVKILIIEGGEPLLWRDGNKSIAHVLEESRKIFPSVSITTNGTLSFRQLELDRVWVSLDGTQKIHDSVRGQGVFSKVLENLEERGHCKAYISFTISQLNRRCVPDLLTMLRGKVAGVTVQFYYPYSGLPDPLFISPEERVSILDQLIQLKGDGYPVANSFSCLNDMKKTRWTCYDGLLANAEPDGRISHGCYLKNRGPSRCEICGFSAHNEISLAFQGNLESIMTGLKIFF
ncbi:MAG: radical SAM protein [Desulfomonilaceae bacterium]